MDTYVWNDPVSGDWTNPDAWNPRHIPSATADVTISVAGNYTVDITTSVSADSLTLTNPDAVVADAGQLVLANTASTLGLSAGTFQLTGTVTGGTLSAGGGTYLWSGGTLDGVTYAGLLDLTAPGASVWVVDGLTATAVDGTSPGSIDIGNQASLNFADTEDFDGATITLGGQGSALNDSVTNAISQANVGQPVDRTLILRPDTTIVQTGTGDAIGDGGDTVNAVTIENQGTIDARAGSLVIDPTKFLNVGSIDISDAVTIAPADFINSGDVTVEAGGTLSLSGEWMNQGSITVDAGGTLILSGSLTSADLAGITLDGGTLEIMGTLDNSGATLAVGLGTALANVVLAQDGDIVGGVIADAGAGLALDGGTLDGVAYQGAALEISGDSADVTVTDGTTVNTADGSAPGVIEETGADDSLTLDPSLQSGTKIDIAGEGDFLQVDQSLSGVTIDATNANDTINVDNTETIDNATITLSSQGDVLTQSTTYAYLAANGNEDGTLTLGPNLTLDAEGSDEGVGIAGNVVNDGTMNIEAGGFAISLMNFTNTGIINVGSNDSLAIQSTTFTNTSTGVIDVDDATLSLQSTALTVAGTISVTNQGAIHLGGSVSYNQLVSAYISIDATSTIYIDGLLDITGHTLDVGPGATVPNLVLDTGGEIVGGVIEDAGLGLILDGGLLDDVAYDGAALNIIADSSYAALANGTTVNTADGSAPGVIEDVGQHDSLTIDQSLQSGTTIDLYGVDELLAIEHPLSGVTINAMNGSDHIYVYDVQTIDNTTITLGSYANILDEYTTSAYYSAHGDQGATLTLGPSLVLDAQGFDGTNNGVLGNAGVNAGAVVNDGTINIVAGVFYIDPTTFTNAGTIDVSAAATLFLQPQTDFANLVGTTLTGGTYSVGPNATIELASNQSITELDADLTLSGTGSVLDSFSDGTGIEIGIDSTLSAIGAAGALRLLAGRGLTTASLSDTGLLQLGGGTLATTLTIQPSGTLSGYGTATGAIANAGLIEADGGTLLIQDDIAGAGNARIDAGATLELGGAFGETVDFAGAADTLQLDQPGSFTGTLTGLVVGDVLDFGSALVSSATPDGTTLDVTVGGTTYAVDTTGLPAQSGVQISPDQHEVTIVPSPITLTTPAGETVGSGQIVKLPGFVISATQTVAQTYTVTLSGTTGTLSATQSGGATVTGAGSTSLTLTGGLADVNAVLASLTYTGADPGLGVIASDTIQAQVSDGTGVTVGATTTLSVQEAAVLVNGLGGLAGFGTGSFGPSDDGSTGAIDITPALPNGIDLFGTVYTSIYINNNGNITFNGPLGEYTPQAIGAGYTSPIIAPYWADVYTDNGPVAPTGGNATGANLLYYDVDAATNTVTVTWDDVGYYAAADKVNAFQLQLIGESNGATEIRFIYQDIQWTTGSASGGVDGLGGTPARVGYSAGNGVNEYEIPASANQAALLALPTTIGNTGLPGVYVFQSTGSGIYSLAAPVVSPRTVDFGALHVGATASQALSVANEASAPGEGLDASISSGDARIATSGSISLLAAGQTDTSSLVVGLNTGADGLISGSATVALESDGTGTSGAGITPLAAQTVSVLGTIYARAEAAFSTTQLDLGAARIGDAALQGSITISDGFVADPYQEDLVYAAGDQGGTLASGHSAALDFGLATTTAGDFSGAAAGSEDVTLTSTGAGTSGLADTSLGELPLEISARIYTPATADYATTLDFGIVHVGDAAAQTLSIANTATGALADALTGDVGPISDSAFAGSGALGDVAAGSSGSLGFVLDTSTAGAYDATATLALASHDGELADLALTTAPVTLNGTVNNYATATLEEITSGATVDVTDGTIDLGSILLGTPPVALDLAVANSAAGPADALSGSFTVSAAAGFSNLLAAFSDIAAGGSSDASVTFDPSEAVAGGDQLGVFRETVTLDATGSNASGYSGALADETVTIVGTLAGANPVLNTPQTSVLSVVRVGETDQEAVSITNDVPAGGPALNASVGAVSGDATASGAFTALAAGATDDSSIVVGLDTATAGDKSGAVTLDFGSAEPLNPPPEQLQLSGVVDNYATAAISASTGVLTGSGGSYTLDLGTVDQGGASPQVQLSVRNLAATGAPSDDLAGAFRVAGNAAFADSGFGAFAGLAAGASDLVGNITLNTGAAGVFQETLTLDPASTNSSEPDATLTPATLTIVGTIVAAPALEVSAVVAPADAIAGQIVPVSWTITNQGSATATGPWTDEVFLASDPAGDNAIPLGAFAYAGTLGVGQTLTRTVDLTLPTTVSGDEWIVVKTDVADQVANDVADAGRQGSAPAPIDIQPPAQPNLVVSSITPPTSAFSGEPTQVSWVVTNTGAGGTSSTYWVDNVYLSLDRTLDTSDILLASIPNPSYLAAGASYQSSATVTLPQGISGPYYIIVYADVSTASGPHGGSQIIASQVAASTPFPVELSPTPNLQISTVITPAEAFSGQTDTLSWTITNAGSGPTDVGQWTDEVLLSQDGSLDSSSVVLATVGHNGVLAPGGSYTSSATVTLPIGISGSYKLFVVADEAGQVYELGDASAHSGSAPVLVNLTPPPDLEVTVGALPSLITGHSLTVSYTVTNAGSTATPNTGWTDSIYLSSEPTLGADAILLGNLSHGGALDVGQSYKASANFTLPDGLAGQYYVIVQTDSGDSVFELDKANNVAAGAPVTIDFNPVDLVVSSVKAPSAATAGHQILVTWQVANTGSGDTANDVWTDRIILSASGVLGAADNIVLFTTGNPKELAGNGSYTNSATVDLPNTLGGTYTLFVVTDTGDTVAESNFANNASAGLTLSVAPLPELAASAVSGPTTDTAGDTVTVSWTVTNTGAAKTGASAWQDDVYLSATPSLTGGHVYLGEIAHVGALASGGSYTAQASVTLPLTLPTGQYYFVVQPDAQGQVPQADGAGVTGGSAADSVTALPSQGGGSQGGGGSQTGGGSPFGSPVVGVAPPSDLSITAVTAPSDVESGQTITVNWTLTNTGNATTAGWSDEVYLSRNQVLGATSDVPLGAFAHTTPLAAGASQSFSATFTVPNGLSGPYYAFVVADAGNALNDPDRGNNTAASTLLQVDLPAPVDLTVGLVSIVPDPSPLVIIAGQSYQASDTVTVTYTVDNLSDTPANGSWKDAVYLSSTGVWNVNDELLGYVQHTGGIAANGSYTATLTGVLPGLVDGNYYAIVKTNVFDNQPESTLSNNTGVSAGTVNAAVTTLTPGTSFDGSLTDGGVAYFQFTVAAGQTVNLAMTSANAGAANDLYVSYGAIPTIGQFDVTATDPTSPNPSAVIQETKPGTYYVMVDESAGGQETYSLTASIVGFSITGITPDAGSNLGSVTLTISGAKFDANARVELVAPDGTVLDASKITWVNSGELWATFDLQGAAVGGYTVRIDDSGQTASLADGFAVTSGPAGQLSVSLVAPAQLHTHNSPDGLTGTQAGIATIVYTNTGGTDVAAPIFDLQATNAEFNAGVTGLVSPSEITVVGTSQTGPAGILAPGAQETISYTFAGNFGFAQFINMTLSLGTLQGSDAVIDWSSLEAGLRPASIDSADWAVIWERFQAQVGGTTQTLLNALSQAANTLSQIGDSTSDLDTLLSYELEQASGALPNVKLAQTTDLADTGTGIDLSLTRLYSASLLERSEAGDFGLGWTFTYGIQAITDAAGNVYVKSPSGTEMFTLQSDGSYAGTAGDSSTLTLVNGGYVLTASNGTVEKFLPGGMIGTITDAAGHVVTVSYGSNGFISGVTSSNGQSLSFTTNATGEITSATDGNGQTVNYTYDAAQHLVSVSGPGGVISYSYDASGNPLSENALTGVTNPDGTTQTFAYDGEGSLSSQSGSGGVAQISYSYDGPGTVVETDANGNASTLIYDTNGNLAEVQDAEGHVDRLTYDSSGNLASVTDPTGATYSFTHDADGNVTGYTDPLGGTVHATYAPGTKLLTSFTDQDGNITHYSYDASGNLAGITYDDGSGTTYQYSASGALTETTDARGQTTQYAYNANGQVTSETFADGTSQAYSYDARGDLLTAKATDGGVTHYTYNAAGELTSVTDPAGRVESYGYNAGGQEIQRVEPDGSITNYAYNAAGQISQLTDGSGNLLVRYSYDAAGQLTGANMGNGASTFYSYDALGNVTEIQTKAADGSVTSQLDYTYNAGSQPVTETSLDGTWTYTYDAAGQITNAVFASTNASIASQNLTYVYDAAGNRTETIFNGAVTDYTTNGLNQYTSADGTTYDYDADGNLVSKTSGGQTTTYSYNSQNQLISETGPNGTTTYQYDALGNQVSSTVNGVRSDYVIDPLAISTSATGPLPSIAQVYNASGAAIATYDYGDGLAAISNSQGTFFYNADAQGNVVSLGGAGGVTVQSYIYDPFGDVLVASGDIRNPFQFSGKLGIATDFAGNSFMGARFYDASLGRFISRDPTNINGGTNLYVYALNKPLTLIDPSGTDSSDFFGGGGLGFYRLNDDGSVTDDSTDPYLGSKIANDEERQAEIQQDQAQFQNIGVGVFRLGLGEVQFVGGSSYFLGLGPRKFLFGLIGANTVGTSLTDLYAAKNVVLGVKNIAEGETRLGLPDLLSYLFPSIFGPSVDVAGVKSVDPNEIIAPAGYGTQAFIAASATDAYTIDFENATTATAPAQQITITQQLDANLDWRTFRLTGFGFDNLTTTLSGSQPFYSGLLDYSVTKGYDVEVTAGVNVATGLVTWTFLTIDPATGQAPQNPQLGLLPVDDDQGDGQGFVSYTIQAKSGVQTGAIVSAQASVVFDTNPPLATPTVTNTIDAVAPTSAVAALPSQTDATSFDVSWSGTDDAAGSGTASYTILVSEDGGTPTVWLANTTRTDAIFQATLGHSYGFNSIATDNAGNVQATPATPDTVIEVGAVPLALASAQLVPTPIAFGDVREGSTAQQALAITNAATAPAEALDASVASVAGAATATGSLSLLAAGALDSSSIVVGLRTGAAGVQSGSVTLDLASDGTGLDDNGVTPLAAAIIGVTGTVFLEAQPTLSLPSPLVLHVGDSGAVVLTISNAAGYVENLLADVTATGGAVSAPLGTLGEIAAGGSASLPITLPTAASGAVAGSLTIAYESDGAGTDGAALAALGTQTLPVDATIDNYATADIGLVGAVGTLTGAGDAYTLDFGTLIEGSGAVTAGFAVLNAATGVADLLSGAFSTTGGVGFTNAGLAAFSGLGAGQSDTAPLVTLATGQIGTFSETLTLDATGGNASGYSGALTPETITIVGTVAPSTTVQGAGGSGRSGGTGQRGTAGQPGTATANAADTANNAASAQGGAGGAGGGGFNSATGAAGNSAPGAPGGAATAAATTDIASATTPATASATSTGGTGGAAGTPGRGTTNGHGAEGGTGGTATATASATNTDGAAIATAVATGGTGGSGTGPSGATGAPGGVASGTTASAHGTTAATASVTQTGGAGGSGSAGAGGNYGASSTLNDAVSGSTEGGTLTLYQEAVGGNGGSSDTGSGGAAGSASSTLDFDDLTQNATESAVILATVLALGGVAGTGGLYHPQGGTAAVSAEITGAHSVTTTGTATGGSAPDSGGGTATATVTSTGGEGASDAATATATATGGAGGSIAAGGSGWGYGGGAVSATTAVASGGAATTTATGTGGAGGGGAGAGRAGGTGGAASATTATARGVTAATATATQIGGAGGAGTGGASGGNGAGSSLVNAVTGSTSGGTLSLTQIAEAGAGGASDTGAGGTGGNAISQLTLNDATSADPSATILAAVEGIGGAGGSGTSGGSGGSTWDSAAIAGAGSVSVTTTAEGGSAGAAGGQGGAAQALTSATGQQVQVVSVADAGAGTTAGIAKAVAGGTGASGSATAQSQTSLLPGGLLVGVSGDAVAPVDGGSTAASQSTIGATQVWGSGYSAAANIEGAPAASAVTPLLAANANTQSALGGPASVLAFGELAGGHAASGGSQTSTASVSLTLNLLHLAASPDLFLAFDAPAASASGVSGVGISVLADGTSLLSQNFATAAAAKSWFSDHPIDLGPLTSGVLEAQSTLTLTASLSVTTAQAGGFQTQFLIGEAAANPHYALV